MGTGLPQPDERVLEREADEPGGAPGPRALQRRAVEQGFGVVQPNPRVVVHDRTQSPNFSVSFDQAAEMPRVTAGVRTFLARSQGIACPATLLVEPREQLVAASGFVENGQCQLLARLVRMGERLLDVGMPLTAAQPRCARGRAARHPRRAAGDWAVAIAAQIATILAAAHAVSLVHRDLKPRNVMLSRGGMVRILDFGVAALLDPEITRVTAAGETVSSPSYMPPEQIISATVSPRSDLYTLGCVLHELLAGQVPCPADTAAATMYAHLERAPAPLGVLRPDVPEVLAQLVLELLAKNPEARPADAEHVYHRLQPFLPPADADLRGEERDPQDPTRPYRRPLPPALTPASPLAAPAQATPDSLGQVRQQALELAEDGRFTQAAELLTRRLRNAPEPTGDLLAARLQLAHTLLLGGDYQRALPEFENLAAELAARHDPGDSEVLGCRVQIATCRAELGALTSAIDELKSVLELQRGTLGDTDPEVLDLRRQLGLLLASSGALDEAERTLRQLRRDKQQQLGDEHPEVRELDELTERVSSARGGGEGS